MKGFMLNEKGDVVIESGEIQMAHDAELTMQKIKSVLETQKGEWFLDWEEGIDRGNILGKRANVIDEDIIKAEILDALSQVDENLAIDEIEVAYESEKRILRVYFRAVNQETNEVIEFNDVLG